MPGAIYYETVGNWTFPCKATAVIHPQSYIDQVLILFIENGPEDLFLSKRDWVVSALYGLTVEFLYSSAGASSDANLCREQGQ